MQEIEALIAGEDMEALGREAVGLAAQGDLELLHLMNAVERLTGAGRKETVKQLYNAWLEHTTSPAAYVAYFNFGVFMAGELDHPQAERLYRRALELNPGLIQAMLNLSNSVENQGRVDESVELLRLVLEVEGIGQPENKALLLHALNNLGRILEGRRRFKESLDYLERSFAIDPSQKDVLLHLVHLRQKQCLWPIFTPSGGVTQEEMVRGTSPLAMLAATDDPELQLGAATRFVDFKYQPSDQRLAPAGGYGHDKVRIGYLSSDLCMHAVSLLTVELYELHDRERFEVYAFCWSKEDGTELRARVKKAMDHFIPIGGMSDQEAAEKIRSCEIDIIIDLHGLTSGARPMILARRPAPLQMTYLGFPGTTGLPWIDYVICDRYLIPEESAKFFVEKPLYLPNCFQASDSKRPVGATPSRADNRLPENAFVFCSFNNNYKYTPELFKVWMRILKRVPGSVLWLLADNEWSHESLCRAAEKHGVAKERLIFAPRVAPPDYLARYQLADLFLDTFPFNGGTTANDALFMGLPLLTCSGRTFASRMAGSLLTHLGLTELITKDFKEYENKAVSLGRKRAEHTRIRNRLSKNKSQGTPFDIPAFVKEYEARLLGAMDELRSGAAQVEEGHAEQALSPARIEAVAGQPLVSILIPSYKAQYFEFALLSAISQSYQHTEIIVSDDCPTDAIKGIVDRYRQIRPITYMRNPNPDGVGANNHINCLRLARGEYVKFLNDDDVLMPFAVQYMVDAFTINAAVNPRLVVSERWYIDSASRFLGSNRLPVQNLSDITDQYIARFMALRNENRIGEFTTAMWRREDSFDQNGLPRFARIDGREIVALVDVAMWINLAQLGRVLYIPLPLSCFRKHGEQNSSAEGSSWYYRMATEWEIVIDHALGRKLVSVQEALPALDTLLLKFRHNQAKFPQLQPFGDRLQARLEGLREAEAG